MIQIADSLGGIYYWLFLDISSIQLPLTVIFYRFIDSIDHDGVLLSIYLPDITEPHISDGTTSDVFIIIFLFNIGVG